jgi:hypothetical protein
MAKKLPTPDPPPVAPPAAPATPPRFADRVKAHRRVAASSIHPHPQNWRTHDQAQRAVVAASLLEVGLARSLLTYEDPEWGLTLIDGHLRGEELGDQEVTVEVLDLTRDEARKLLSIMDPTVGLAGVDQERLQAMLAEIDFESEELARLAASFVEEKTAEKAAASLKQIDVKPPPAMTWVLLGLPTVRFGEIAEAVMRLAEVPGIVLETTANDGKAK